LLLDADDEAAAEDLGNVRRRRVLVYWRCH
jgi:hypothetical protein